jgi:beta-glucanase (GH16 family)
MHDDDQTADAGTNSDNKWLGRRTFLGTTAALVGSTLATGGVAGAPYGGSRHAIPGRIEAEDYDTGGSGYAYSDTTAGNTGKAYRSDDVDIEAGASGYNVGWTESGEWLNYSATTASAGTYEVTIRVASGGGGGTLVVQEDQVDKATFDVPDTGGWQSWTTMTQQVDLAGGDHTIAAYFTTGGVNFDWLEFSEVSSGGGGISPGTYRITNVNSGKALEVAGGSSATADGDNVQQWSWNDGDWQKWSVEDVGNGLYSIRPVHSGKALDVSGCSTSDGANVQQWSYVGSGCQHYNVQQNSDGTYRIIASHSGKSLDVSNFSTADGATVVQWPYNGTDNQKWELTAVSSGSGGTSDPYPNLDGNSWTLSWSDEFDGGIDTSIWNYDTGNGCPDLCGWGNNELQAYQTDNVWTENGRLIIEARDETASNQYGTYDYTSGKLTTEDKKLKQYGRIDVRAKLPKAAGVWPAIWMLGNDIDEATWPDCGEIDIMENFGNDWTTSHSTIHGPGYSGGSGISASYSGPDLTAGFHDYQLTWYQDTIKFWLDGNLVNTITASDVGSNTWAFNDDFYLILNVAIGGTLGSTPDPADYPARMEIEHVRYYD